MLVSEFPEKTGKLSASALSFTANQTFFLRTLVPVFGGLDGTVVEVVEVKESSKINR